MPAAGPQVLALATYPDSSNGHADELNAGGVASVDDAGRACVLLCRLWVATGNGALRRWAEGLFDFVLWMYAGDGLWVNFVNDWDGTKNIGGTNSAPGINAWQAQAMLAIAEANLVFDDGRARGILAGALSAAASSVPPSDIRAIHALAVLALLVRAPDPWLISRLGEWCNEIVACQRNGVLMNSPDERGAPQLCGHVQEAVLADASVILGRRDLRTLAISSGTDVFARAIESGFDLPHVHGHDVLSAAYVMERLAAVTGRRQYSLLAGKARGWFDGRNASGSVVFDRLTGRVADGIDNGRLDPRSGAEAGISAGLALFADPQVLASARGWKEPERGRPR